MKSTHWTKIKGQLGQKTDRDFERAVAAVLSLRWLGIVQATPRRHFDRQGIDVLAWGNDGTLDCVVQCKGFEVMELLPRHVTDAQHSIDAYMRSGIRSRSYLFIYNRERRNYPFHGAVEMEVQKLVTGKLCETAEVWDLDRLLREHQADVLRLVEQALRDNTRRMLDRLARMFDVGHTIIKEVPLSQKRLELRRGEPAQIFPENEVCDRCVGDILVNPDARRWSILIGEFGTGKSTAALHAAAREAQVEGATHHILYAEARLFDPGSISNLNGLLGQILQSAGLSFGTDLNAGGIDQQDLVNRAVPLLKEEMKRPDSPYILIIDGLDENKIYSTSRGMVNLNNGLVELGCPSILITRREHFISTFENFTISSDELAQKFGSKRAATLFELHRWQDRHVTALIDIVLAGSELNPTVAGRLREFRDLVEAGETARFYANLRTHPLFLRFILDDVAADGIQLSNRSQLLERWVRRKLERELLKGRDVELSRPADAGSVVDALMLVMEAVAAAMVTSAGGAVTTAESLPVEGLTGRLGGHLDVVRSDLTTLLLNTVLVPIDFRGAGKFRISFAFMVFRDFFLARHLLRTGGETTGFPAEVQELVGEMRMRPPHELSVVL